MAMKQIAARLGGDDYQARFFWYQAARLLTDRTHVTRVILENDEAPHVDDVTVHYAPPGKLDGDEYISADYFQVKYHVDRSEAYNSEALTEPAFIGSKKRSMLGRFFDTHLKLLETEPSHTLALVSNWAWDAKDPLGRKFRSGGRLPEAFFKDGPRTKIGKVRELWKAHLGCDDATLHAFAKRLRLKVAFFDSDELAGALRDRLRLAGLEPDDPTQRVSRYDELARKFLQDGVNEFDADTLRRHCRDNGLLATTTPPRRRERLGFRTRVPDAENLESEVDAFVAAETLFDDRAPRDDNSWTELYKRFKDFVDEHRSSLTTAHDIALDCHASAAVTAGFLLGPRASVWPLGPRPVQAPCEPNGTPIGQLAPLWSIQRGSLDLGGEESAIALSITHRIGDDVRRYLTDHVPSAGQLIEFVPSGGTGHRSVEGPDHACALIESLCAAIRDETVREMTKHVFIAGPNFLSFMLGQRLQGVGPVLLYEYGFGSTFRYQPSLRLPLNSTSKTAT